MWRAEIRRQARADRLKVRTGVTAGKVWAMLAGDIPAAQQDENLRYFHLFTSDLEPRAEDLGHQVRVVIRDGEEALLICRACGVRGYADAAAGPLIGGPLFEDEVPGGRPARRLTSSGPLTVRSPLDLPRVHGRLRLRHRGNRQSRRPLQADERKCVA